MACVDHRNSLESSDIQTVQVHSNIQNIYSVIQMTRLRKHLLTEELNYSAGRTNTCQQGITL